MRLNLRMCKAFRLRCSDLRGPGGQRGFKLPAKLAQNTAGHTGLVRGALPAVGLRTNRGKAWHSHNPRGIRIMKKFTTCMPLLETMFILNGLAN